MITIDGTPYNVPILSCDRTADSLDRYARRTVDGVLHRKLIGIFYNYKVKFGTILDTTLYNSLWDKLSEPVEFHTILIPNEPSFTGYIGSIKDAVKLVSGGTTYYMGLCADFIQQGPSRS